MAIPDYQSLMLPVLQFACDEKEHSTREAIDVLASTCALTDEERNRLLPSGQQPTFDNRVNWAVSYLKKAGVLQATRRAHFRITSRGLDLLREAPARVDVKLLERFPEFVEFRNLRNTRSMNGVPPVGPNAEEEEDETPQEAIESAYQKLRNELASELIQQVLSCSPAFFERLVIDLLLQMGYGGTRRDAGEAIGRSGDGGIDGIIKEDRLGLDVIYIQAKRWQGSVGRPEIQKFVGALQGQRARKGIFITTSTFTADAVQYTSYIDTKVILIDGRMLASLMIDHGVGVTTAVAYEIKRMDSDYFSDS
ncbi:MAG: restriction endonuclease [Gemmatimonadetes bacterium]|nr:restriction endonuclease [Gemmatimonadota bacterium]